MNQLARRTTLLPDGRVRIQQNALRGALTILSVVGVLGAGASLAFADGTPIVGAIPNLIAAAVAIALLVKVWPARIEVGPDDLVVVNPFRTVRVRRDQVAAVRERSLFAAVPLGLDLHDGDRVVLVGCSRWARRGLVTSPAWFEQAEVALRAWVEHGTRPPSAGTPR